MSLMRWTYKQQMSGVALKEFQVPSVGKSLKVVKVGEKIPIQVWELYSHSRGMPEAQITTEFHYGNAPMPEEAPAPPPTLQSPSGKRLEIKKDFTFDVLESNAMPKGRLKKENLSNNKTVMWLGLIVVGYFAYKYYNKK